MRKKTVILHELAYKKNVIRGQIKPGGFMFAQAPSEITLGTRIINHTNYI